MANLNLEPLLKFSEILLDPKTERIPLSEWLDSYNSAKDGHLKYILHKCIPYTDSLNCQAILDHVEADCPYEKCDLLSQLINLGSADQELIMEWLLLQVETQTPRCKGHCVCSLIKLATEMIKRKMQWPISSSINLLKLVNNQRCGLDCYLDFILVLIESKLNDHGYLEELLSVLESNLNPKDYLPLDGTVDDQPEIIFKEISNSMLLRKLLLPRLIILSQLGPTKLEVQSLNQQIKSMEDLISNAIHWSHHPFIDLYLEEDSMMLECLNSLIKVLAQTNEPAAHIIMQAFLDSINHDVSIYIEWLSDPESADKSLRVLLTYLKLPNINSQCSAMVKLFFNHLFKRIDGLWKKQLFPYNPSALLKYQEKF
ncbi:uncharacterized protein LOC107369481 [Tetranychus urticae]|uniref:Protein Lines C-terminal domain-containing protein n=1 Tax=Tetranychus urticae TaxID=32264 RepID=T1JS49_TETUR|nr:uncharacterized protein LOC107369481 [Tetranychus urticae]